jgi:hypothetical protein
MLQISSGIPIKAHAKAGLLALAIISIVTLPSCWTYSLHPLAEANDPRLIYDPVLEAALANSLQLLRSRPPY